ncbi:MAG: RNA polymerase-binding protein RbpA [Actinomycetaceae bacterium]|nr:RNA polymerase-binding protein RbpA [Actinomycetaceae bacterium]
MPNSAQVEYFCARDHITRVSFTVEALLDAPASWNCTICQQPAYRTRPTQPSAPKAAEAQGLQPPNAFSASHHQELHRRRAPEQAEELLMDALEKLRNQTQPNEAD